jgi:hypothetical protein
MLFLLNSSMFSIIYSAFTARYALLLTADTLRSWACVKKHSALGNSALIKGVKSDIHERRYRSEHV